jgi:hypothetical protein
VQGNRCNAEIVVSHIQFCVDEQIELCPCGYGPGNDGETIPGNNNGGQQHRGRLFGLPSFCRASQGRSTTHLFFHGNCAHAQRICGVTVAGGQNLGMIALLEAERVRVEQEDRPGSWGLAGAGASRLSCSAQNVSTTASHVSNRGFSAKGKIGIGGRAGWMG